MNEIVKSVMEKRIEKTIKALEKNNMKGYYAKNTDEAKSIIGKLIKEDTLILSGGSMTLKEAGVIDFLKKDYKGIFIDRADLNPEEIDGYFRKAFSADTYFTSTNAITENGELYNVDGNGNRVAAMIFGPKQVIVLCGFNKIVPDINSAIKRVEKIAAPANTIRLKKNTPCAKSGECSHCSSEDRICCSYVTLGQQRIADRIKVIFLPDEYGY